MIDPKKTYRTRDGREVRIYATDHRSQYPVVGGICEKSGNWAIGQWTEAGAFWTHQGCCDSDLIEVRPKFHHERWASIYPDNYVIFDETKSHADKAAGPSRIACIKVIIEGEEGDGL